MVKVLEVTSSIPVTQFSMIRLRISIALSYFDFKDFFLKENHNSFGVLSPFTSYQGASRLYVCPEQSSYALSRTRKSKTVLISPWTITTSDPFTLDLIPSPISLVHRRKQGSPTTIPLRWRERKRKPSEKVAAHRDHTAAATFDDTTAEDRRCCNVLFRRESPTAESSPWMPESEGKMEVHSCCSLDYHTTPSSPPSASSPLQEKGDAGNGSRRPESSTVVAHRRKQGSPTTIPLRWRERKRKPSEKVAAHRDHTAAATFDDTTTEDRRCCNVLFRRESPTAESSPWMPENEGKMEVHSCCSLDYHTTPSSPPSAASPLQEKGDAGNGSRRPESSTIVAVRIIRECKNRKTEGERR
nr:hypothetical protein Iba_chr14dCG2100 [Ipomoea batatas]